MANNDVFNCPLCDGQGQLRPAEILNRIAKGNLGEKIQTQLAEITKSGEEQKVLTGMPASGPKALDFQQEVHSWNPQQRLWRRSQKE
jgi:hypothetical protein